MADEVHHVEANGLDFAYLEDGSGPLVLMLHGFPDTAHTRDDLRPRIAVKGYRAVSPFTRGYHPTAIPASDADQERLSHDHWGPRPPTARRRSVPVGSRTCSCWPFLIRPRLSRH